MAWVITVELADMTYVDDALIDLKALIHTKGKCWYETSCSKIWSLGVTYAPVAIDLARDASRTTIGSTAA